MKNADSPWTLAQLSAANRSAVVIYAALRWLSGDKRQLNTTRRKIAAITGMHKDTITKAIGTLREAGWVTGGIGSDGRWRWYQLSFPQKSFFPRAAETGPRDVFPKAGRGGSRENGANGQIRSKGDDPLDRSNRSIPVGVGAAPATALPSIESGSGTAPGEDRVSSSRGDPDECGDRTACRERELLAEIQARCDKTSGAARLPAASGQGASDGGAHVGAAHRQHDEGCDDTNSAGIRGPNNGTVAKQTQS